MTESYPEIYLRDASLTRLCRVDDPVEFEAPLQQNDASTWYLRLPAGSEAGDYLAGWPDDAQARGIIVVKDGVTLLSGPIRAVSFNQAPGEEGSEIELSGIDDTGELIDRLALPVPGGPPYTSAEFDVFTGTAENAIRYYADVNAGLSAVAARRLPGLELGAWSRIGLPISFVAASDRNELAGSNIDIPKPTGAVQEDLLIAYLWFASDATIQTAPPGWTLYDSRTYRTGIYYQQIWYRRIASNDPALYTWRVSYNAVRDALMVGYRGVDTTTPIEAIAFAENLPSNTNNPTLPSVTTLTNNAIVVGMVKNSNYVGVGKIFAPTGWETRLMNPGHPRFIGDILKGTPGAVSGSANAEVSNTWFNTSLVLRPANPTAGMAGTWRARFDNLLELIRSIAAQAGLNFQVAQAADSDTRALTITQTADRSGEVVFSRELQSLSEAERAAEGPTANYVYALGGGEGNQREIVERGDSESIVRYWRAETATDERSKTGAELGQAIDEEIEKGAPHVGYTLEPGLDVFVFGRDYQLGDTVGVVVDGRGYTAVVRTVDIRLDENGYRVVPALTPNVSTGPSRGFSVRSLNTRLNQLERQSEGFTIGMVMGWARDQNFIPSGWQLCDGTGGTLDLRGRFPIGADLSNVRGNGAIALAAIGGAPSYSLAAHAHSHSHTDDHLHTDDHTHADDHWHHGPYHAHSDDHNHAAPDHLHYPGGLTMGGPSTQPTVTAGTGPVAGSNHIHTMSGMVGSVDRTLTTNLKSQNGASGSTGSEGNGQTDAKSTAGYGGNTGTKSSGGNTGTKSAAGYGATTGTDATSTGAATIALYPPYQAVHWIQRVSV